MYYHNIPRMSTSWNSWLIVAVVYRKKVKTCSFSLQLGLDQLYIYSKVVLLLYITPLSSKPNN